MKLERSAGIILHPTSLPGPDGIGDLGPTAYSWVQFLNESGCHLWEILPLGPTGYGDSPYQCFSAFAGNIYLISPILLVDSGILDEKDLSDRPDLPDEYVRYGEVIKWKTLLLDRAFSKLGTGSFPEITADYRIFCKKNVEWLDDFALFMAIKESFGGVSWENWPVGLRQRDETDLINFVKTHVREIEKHKFRQYLFFKQWYDLKAYAKKKEVSIIGDIPIFVSYDSADVWSHPELFHLDAQGKPSVVAGVPPDYFSPTGQLWGNPLYDWDAHLKQNYQWWKDRLRSSFDLYDFIRLDHFRGFAGYWEVSYGMPTAEVGNWIKGPGIPFFENLRGTLGELPIIAEDLGVITPDVVQLRDNLGFPGMKIFQFAFSSDPSDPFLPHKYPEGCIAYTGTHDNDTALGWYNSAPEEERDFIRRYLARSGEDISWDMIRAVWSSVAVFALAPLQDVLKLDSEARMNFPGKPYGNWTWRFTPSMLTEQVRQRLYEVNYLYERLFPDQLPKHVPKADVSYLPKS